MKEIDTSEMPQGRLEVYPRGLDVVPQDPDTPPYVKLSGDEEPETNQEEVYPFDEPEETTYEHELPLLENVNGEEETEPATYQPLLFEVMGQKTMTADEVAQAGAARATRLHKQKINMPSPPPSTESAPKEISEESEYWWND